jgi:hypothetical protein
MTASFVAGVLCSVFCSLMVLEAEDTVGSRWNSEVSFFRPKDRSRKPVTGRSVLTVATVTVKSGDSISDLLRARHVFPNSDVISIVYALNPEVENLTSLRVNSDIKLPSVRETSAIRDALNEGFLLSFSVDRDLKEHLAAAWKTLRDLIPKLTVLNAGVPGDEEVRSRFVESVQKVVDYLHDIDVVVREQSLPLSHDVLTQAYGDAELLQSIVDRSLREGLTAQDLTSVSLIDEDVTIKMNNFVDVKGSGVASSARPRDARVVVSTRRQSDGAPVRDVVVYYVTRALFGKEGEENTFPAAATWPLSAVLPEANYFVYTKDKGSQPRCVPNDPDPAPPSPCLKVIVRKALNSGPEVVDLFVLP